VLGSNTLQIKPCSTESVPPQRKYTLPELKRLLLSSLVTNHVPHLL
jgi:hypothetical protein